MAESPVDTALPRFMAKVDKTDTCWLWLGSRNSNGYGSTHADGRTVGVHRLAYQLFVGPIPEGLEIDHLCRVRHCVNPDHLEAVTHRENTLRGDTGPARNVAKTHCVRGHPFTPENTLLRKDGQRRCRTCYRTWRNAWRKARRV